MGYLFTEGIDWRGIGCMGWDWNKTLWVDGYGGVVMGKIVLMMMTVARVVLLRFPTRGAVYCSTKVKEIKV